MTSFKKVLVVLSSENTEVIGSAVKLSKHRLLDQCEVYAGDFGDLSMDSVAIPNDVEIAFVLVFFSLSGLLNKSLEEVLVEFSEDEFDKATEALINGLQLLVAQLENRVELTRWLLIFPETMVANYVSSSSILTERAWLRSVKLKQIVRSFQDKYGVSIFDPSYASGLLFDEYFSKKRFEVFGLDLTTRALNLSVVRVLNELSDKILTNPIKCIVVDCDNTLWRGVVGEDGLTGISVDGAFIEFQRCLQELASRGILLAIASKNNFDDVAEVLEHKSEMLLKRGDFSAIEIHWGLKSDSIVAIAQKLNIGLESIVFFDDSHVEVEEVKSAIPQASSYVFSEQDNQIENLFETGLFSGLGNSLENVIRKRFFEEQVVRDDFQAKVHTQAQFLEGLDLVADIFINDELKYPRLEELSRKTNQFIFRDKRYQKGQLTMLDENHFVFSGSLKDKFGDYGVVAGCVVESVLGSEIASVDNLFLSCRALSKTFEHAFLDAILVFVSNRGATKVVLNHELMKKNMPAIQFVDENAPHGFLDTSTTLINFVKVNVHGY